jgi:hypothetical protein
MKIEKNYEWQSILDLSGKGLKQFNAVDQGLNATQLLNNAGLDWKVTMKPVFFQNSNNVFENSDRFFSLVRKKGNKEDVLVSGLTSSYHVNQNENMAKLGDHFSRIAGVNFEHAFDYDGGKRVTLLAKTNGGFNIGDDVVNNYLMLNTNHTGRDVNSINTTNIDIWCSNTFMQALKDKDQFFIKLSHRVEYNDQIESMVINKVNEALKFNEEYKEQAQALDTKQLTEREMLNYFILVYSPKALSSFLTSKGDYQSMSSLDVPNLTQVKRCYGVWHDVIESNGKMLKLQNTGNHARKDTMWKAFNCVTYNEDHLRGGRNSVDNRLKNTFVYNGIDNVKNRAMTEALKLVA